MSVSIALVLGLLALATLAFAFEWLPVDLVTLLLLSALVLAGILTPSEAFSGFASEVIIVLACIFVISGALTRTRVLDGLGRALARLGGESKTKSVLGLTSLCAAASAFINNTNATAVLMPAVFELSKRSRIAVSRLLMPLAFASILGGTCTLIGTSTNVAASGMVERLGLEPLGLFELTPVGIPLAMLGVIWLSVIGYRLLPDTGTGELSDEYEVQRYMAGLVVVEDSTLVGQSMREADLSDQGLNVLAVVRAGKRIFPQPELRLRAGDLLLVHGSRDAVVRAKEEAQLRHEADVSKQGEGLFDGEVSVMEAVVLPQSVLVGRTLRQLRVRQRFGVAVLAVYRPGQRGPRDIRNLVLGVGDVLLLQGPSERLRALQESRDLWLLGELEHLPGRERKGLLTLAALAVAVVLGASGWVPLSISLLLAAIAIVLLGVVRIDEVYALIEWRLLVLIGGMTAVGLAMQKTGAAELVASWIVGATMPFGVLFVLGALALLAMVLTQPMSNAAAALVLLPIAVSTAQQLDANPRTFAAMVTLAASLSFITPLEPSCLLVYRPGRYRFLDFVRSGSVLSLLTFVALMLLVPRVWPL